MAADKLVEFRDGKTVTTGRILAKDHQRALLLDRVGQLHDLKLASGKLEATTSQFQSLPTVELRNQLSREFGRDFELGSTRHYLVVAPVGRAAEYANLFERHYSTLQSYFKLRGFTIQEPEFPLVAIVFATQKQFVEYAQGEGSKTMSHMQGYYSPRTNRVALFESRSRSPNVSWLPLPDRQRSGWLSELGAIQTDLQETMIHEATHQIAYNIGLHSRTGETPRWVVEGMATAFEPEGMRGLQASSPPKQRINHERFLVFQNFVQSGRRPAKSLRSFIESDSLYESAVLDFYAQSWALTFFLMETRPRNYSAYLKRIADRDPLADYPAKARLEDFQQTIHPNLDWLDAQFVRYFDGLK
jgi:hypothetical protein